MRPKEEASVTLVPHKSGEVIHIGPLVLHVMEDGSNTDNRIGATHITVPPHTPGPPQHWHQMHDETFLVLTGQVRFTTGTTAHDASAGDYVVVPPLAPHTFSNETDEEATIYTGYTPAFSVNYFRLLQEMAQRNNGKLSAADGAEAMGRYATLQVDLTKEKDV